MEIINRKYLTKYVSAFILGDGWLTRPFKNASYGLHQIADHKDYIDWQANILETLTSVRYNYKDAYINNQGAQAKASIRIQTMVHPFYTTIYERTYINKIKSISPHDLRLLDWETLAILYQDDGYIEVQNRIKMDNYIRIRIATDNYTYGDLLLLVKVIRDRTGISFDIIRRKLKNHYGYRLQATKDQARNFIKGISPYIKDSYRYKVDTDSLTTVYYLDKNSERIPLENQGDDIVSSL